MSAAGNLYARAWLGYRVKDSTSGFRAYRTEFSGNRGGRLIHVNADTTNGLAVIR